MRKLKSVIKNSEKTVPENSSRNNYCDPETIIAKKPCNETSSHFTIDNQFKTNNWQIARK